MSSEYLGDFINDLPLETLRTNHPSHDQNGMMDEFKAESMPEQSK